MSQLAQAPAPVVPPGNPAPGANLPGAPNPAEALPAAPTGIPGTTPQPTGLDTLSDILIVAIGVWLIAELTKYAVGRINKRNRKLFDSGGMPSVHAAVIVGTATAIGIQESINSPTFALAVVVAAIVMHDSFRVRWAAGESALQLNKLLSRAGERTVVVFRGHRIREVLAGAVYGGLLAWGLLELVQYIRT